ncbi:ABC transporter ATP-binding protein [Neisseria sp. Ec49-e6-T10]|uniref:ABC transporter ATP-binding protein n=1 Tax=Neisseria sp. Ec49-e6-T10 TaxID=3140744 RepID=UPI003EBC38DB
MSLTIQNVIVQKSGQNILQIDSLSLPQTGSIALIGPNGAGKSTLLKIMAGLESINQGAVLLNQRPIQSLSGGQRAREIGFIPQHFEPCWNQTVEELINLSASRTTSPKQSQEQICHQFNLTALLNHHWNTLSGGERARVLSAMALAGNPPILFADEPGAALDIKHRLQIINSFSQRAHDHLVVVCLHELDLAFRFFDQVILLEKGQMTFYGSSKSLLHSAQLDQAFDVVFERIFIEDGYHLLHAKKFNI